MRLFTCSRKMRQHEHAMIERWMVAVSGASAAVSVALPIVVDWSKAMVPRAIVLPRN